MKRYPITKLLLTIMALVSVSIAKGQDAPKGQLYLIHEDKVKPSMIAEYESAAKGFYDAIAKYTNGSLKYWLASRDDFTYIYVIPVENYAGIDKVDNTFSEMSKAMGKEAMEATMKKFDGTFTTHRDFMVSYRADLSYMPDFPAENTFRHWDYYYLNPDKENEAMAIAKDWKALFEKKKIPSGYRFNIANIGLEPTFIVVFSGKDAASFYTERQEINKMLGDEGAALMQRTRAAIIRIDHKDGKVHPDLSFNPSTTTKK